MWPLRPHTHPKEPFIGTFTAGTTWWTRPSPYQMLLQPAPPCPLPASTPPHPVCTSLYLLAIPGTTRPATSSPPLPCPPCPPGHQAQYSPPAPAPLGQTLPCLPCPAHPDSNNPASADPLLVRAAQMRHPLRSCQQCSRFLLSSFVSVLTTTSKNMVCRYCWKIFILAWACPPSWPASKVSLLLEVLFACWQQVTTGEQYSPVHYC